MTTTKPRLTARVYKAAPGAVDTGAWVNGIPQNERWSALMEEGIMMFENKLDVLKSMHPKECYAAINKQLPKPLQYDSYHAQGLEKTALHRYLVVYVRNASEEARKRKATIESSAADNLEALSAMQNISPINQGMKPVGSAASPTVMAASAAPRLVPILVEPLTMMDQIIPHLGRKDLLRTLATVANTLAEMDLGEQATTKAQGNNNQTL